jgi:hypothetical protein
MLYLILDLGTTDPIQLRFAIRNTPIADAWVKHMTQRHAWPLDDTTNGNLKFWFVYKGDIWNPIP